MKVDLAQVVTNGSLCGHCKRPLLVVAGKCLVCGEPQK